MSSFKSKLDDNRRHLSIDVFRGITIFLMIIVNTPGSLDYVYSPLKHSFWHGCSLADLVFPSFIFIVGLSMSMSFRNISKKSNMLRVLLRRTLLILLVGILLNWFPFFNTNIDDLRMFGVLQRIALSYFGAGAIIIYFTNKRLIFIFSIILLLIHWVILFYYGDSNPYSLNGNFSKEIDLFFLSEDQMYKGFNIPFDPEGILGALSSVSQVLFGFLTGNYIFIKNKIKKKRSYTLVFSAFFLIIISLIWDVFYPINKPLWTGSYVFYTTGILILILVLLIWIVDVKNKIKWSFLFMVFGRNSLTSYVLSIICLKCIYVIKINGASFYSWSYHNFFLPFFNFYFSSFLYSISFALLMWFFIYLIFTSNKLVK